MTTRKISTFLKSEKMPIFALLAISFFARLILYKDYDLLWDSAVYTSMGKYIYTMGKIGLWEPIRPLLWPLIMGGIWRLGLDVIRWGRVLEIFFSLGAIYFVYQIGRHLADRKTGLIAALLLSFSPNFFAWGNIHLTSIPSSFFVMCGLYLFMRSSYLSSGILMALAAMTRFPQGIIFISALFFMALHWRIYRPQLKEASKFLWGFALVVAPFLVVNQLLYGDILLPFKMGSAAVEKDSYAWLGHTNIYYLKKLLGENLLLTLALPGFIYGFRKKEPMMRLLLISTLFITLYYASLVHKEFRYLLVILPFLYLMSALAIGQLHSFCSNRSKMGPLLILAVVASIWIHPFPRQVEVQFSLRRTLPHENYLYLEKNKIEGEIWTSNPRFTVNSDVRVDELIYFGFGAERAKWLREHLDRAELVFVDTRDFPCAPGDEACDIEKSKFMDALKERFDCAAGASTTQFETGIYRKTEPSKR
ncbi:MAG: glycosyltransferase family 39 protein [Candidatus Omnitrophica bacterium]|nr:glycosyltransferase family 39 protein [Candidatus Omnitrophota bacterium]